MPWCPVLLNKHTVKCERAVSIKPKINHSARTSTNKRERQAKIGWSNKWWEELVGSGGWGGEEGRIWEVWRRRSGKGRFGLDLAQLWSVQVELQSHFGLSQFKYNRERQAEPPENEPENEPKYQQKADWILEDQPQTCGWKPLRRWRT